MATEALRTNAPAYFEPGRILTFTGRLVAPLALRAEDIDLEDIAHSLACQNRFTGHTRAPYSVAQHCVHVAEHLPPELRVAGLLHDASEAYLIDVATPIKALPEFAGFKTIEAAVQRAIERRFGLAEGALSAPMVKTVDKRMCATEALSLMHSAFKMPGVEPFAVDGVPERIHPWRWDLARDEWRWLATELGLR